FFERPVANLVCAGDRAAILPTVVHKFLGGLSFVEIKPAGLPPDQHPVSGDQRRPVVDHSAPTERAGCLAGGGHFCGTSGECGIGGVDNRTQERVGRFFLLEFGAGLPPVLAASHGGGG